MAEVSTLWPNQIKKRLTNSGIEYRFQSVLITEPTHLSSLWNGPVNFTEFIS